MKSLTTLFLSIVFISCSAQGIKRNFDEFSRKFLEINLPFHINDSLAFNNWNSKDLLLIDDIKEYDLVTKFASKDYPLEIQQFECSRVGKYRMENYTVILYKTYTTMAGRGNPVIILSIFTDSGEKKDEEMALWDATWDPLYSQEVTLSIPNDSTFLIKSIVNQKGLLKGKIVPKRETERVFIYLITKDGIIEKLDETVRVLFEDNNPEILDDF